MPDKDKHIIQKLGDEYPKPDVPAGDAWANMKDMLNQEMPLTEIVTPEKYAWVKLFKIVSSVAVLLTTAVIIWLSNSDAGKASLSFVKEKLTLTQTQKSDNPLESDPEGARTKEANGLKNSLKFGTQMNAKSDNTRHDSLANLNEGVSDLSIFAEKRKEISDKNNQPGHSQNHNVDGRTSTDLKRNRRFKNAIGNEPVKNNLKKNDESKNRVNNPEHVVNKAHRSDRSSSDIQEEKSKNFKSQQNNFSGNPDSETRENQPVSSIGLLNTTEKPVIKETNTLALPAIKPQSAENILKKKFESIIVTKPLVFATPEKSKKGKIVKIRYLLNDVHAGVQWNANLPMQGYDQYFTGANNKSNQFYTPLIPGFWITKTLKNRNELMLKFTPYSQYFGNNKLINSSTIFLADSTSQAKTTNLIKISGLSGGLQYNQHIYDRWSIGLGINAYWQNKALVNYVVKGPVSQTILSDTIVSVKETSNEGNYLKLNFVTTNMEVLYSWRNFQFGGGIIIPVTSMTALPANKIRPLNGQLVFRWRLK